MYIQKYGRRTFRLWHVTSCRGTVTYFQEGLTRGRPSESLAGDGEVVAVWPGRLLTSFSCNRLLITSNFPLHPHSRLVAIVETSVKTSTAETVYQNILPIPSSRVWCLLWFLQADSETHASFHILTNLLFTWSSIIRRQLIKSESFKTEGNEVGRMSVFLDFRRVYFYISLHLSLWYICYAPRLWRH